MPNRISMILLLASLLMLRSGATPAAPLGRGFTYQGQLQQAGIPAEGAISLRFSLWNAAGSGDPPTGGVMVGGAQTLVNVPVTGGIFSVTLNGSDEFGAQAFNGEGRWLQVEVCGDSTCTSTTVLGPRQAITGAPYALGPWQLTGANLSYSQGNVGIGTSAPILPLHVKGAGESVRIEGASAGVANMAYVGFGKPGGALSGYVGDAGVGDDDTYLGSQANNVNIYAGGFVLSAQTNGRVGIGTYSPADRLEVRGNIRLGAFGEYFAPGSPENLRIIRGKVSAAGGVVLGSGFTATRSAAGVYSLTFSPAFPVSQFPIVTVSAESNGTVARFAMVNSPSHISVVVRIVNGSGTAADADFYFIAAGPR